MISEETKQKISLVAESCIRCGRCMKECLMLNRFAKNPKMLFTRYLEQGPENMDRHIAYSCNECSQCTLKCPRGLDLKSVFQSLKADYAAENDGVVPVEALIPSEEGQERECSPDYCAAVTAGSGHGPVTGRVRYLFVPGQFPAHPILQHLQSALGRTNVALLDPKCSMDEQLEELDAEVLITACPSDFQALRQTQRQQRVLFYWDLMENIIGIPEEAQAMTAGAELQLHDTETIGSSIRWALKQLGCSWTEQADRADLQTADQDCRQVLGLLFGTR